ncbi:hypothetical protein RhiLY_00377 [Ceratobasidium sp. AG-Ba]|nr:hypothetical protein RhiLY_00377 [Ceratobasidium sp. AG-Ba]
MVHAIAYFGTRGLLCKLETGSKTFMVDQSPTPTSVSGTYYGPKTGEQEFTVHKGSDGLVEINIGSGKFTSSTGIFPIAEGSPTGPGIITPSSGSGNWESA